MTTGSIGPGTVLAGRYRLDDLLAESGGARFWRATDMVLARDVAIHAVPSDDERASGLLEAARVSATVTDAHLLRVLDCDNSGGICWVVNEWGDGTSLDLMLQHGPLSPSRAAWLAREVAEAVAAGHAQGVAHGRLNPEAVMVTHAGAVKLIGYVIDAALISPRPEHPVFGSLDEREADVINVAGILYAALTGRWPGVASSAVPAAPAEGGRPLRPRQVRAGVPRVLDAICDKVLNKEASQHAMPIESAHEIAAALSDYVGDPSLLAPMDPSTMHTEQPGPPSTAWQRPSAAAHEQPTRTIPTPAEPGSSAEDLEATQAWQPPPAADLDAADGPDRPGNGPADGEDPHLDLRVEDQPPAGSNGDGPDARPLFATTERRVPAAARAAQAAHAGQAPTSPPPGAEHDHGSLSSTDHGPLLWSMDDLDPAGREVHTGKEGRGWLRTAVVIGLLTLLVIAMVIAFNVGRGQGGDGGPAAAPRSPDQQSAGLQPVAITAATDFDPEGDPPEENPGDTGLAIDDDPASGWHTMTYRNRPDLGGLKSGVGLMLELGQQARPRELTVRFRGSPTSFEVYAAPSGVTEPPGQLDQMNRIGEKSDAGERVRMRLSDAPETRFVLIWMTELPPADGGYRGEITDVEIQS